MGARWAPADEARMAAWFTLMQAYSAVVDGLEDRMQQELELPLSWHEVLVRLQGSPAGRMRMQDLARSVLLSKSGISRLVDRMQEAGLVGRDACSADRRVTYATITSHGRSTLRHALPVFLRGFDEHFGRHVSEADAQALLAALGKVLSAHHCHEPVCPSAYSSEGPAAG